MKKTIIFLIMILLSCGLASGAVTYNETFDSFGIDSTNLTSFDGCGSGGCPDDRYGTLNTTILSGNVSYIVDQDGGTLRGVYKDISGADDEFIVSFLYERFGTGNLIFYAGSALLNDAGYNDITIYMDSSDLYIFDGGSATDTTENLIGSTIYNITIDINNTNNSFRLNIDGGTWRGWYDFRNGASTIDYISFTSEGTNINLFDDICVADAYSDCFVEAPIIPINFSCWGSSTTLGAYIGAGDFYCPKVEPMLESDGNNYTNNNHGQSGHPIFELTADHIGDITGQGYNFTFLLTPPNDRLQTRNTTQLELYNNYTFVAEQLEADNQTMLILGGWYETNYTTPPGYNNSAERTKEGNDVFRRLSFDYKNNTNLSVCWVDMRTDALFGTSYNGSHFDGDDGVHPTAIKQTDIALAFNESFFNCTYYNCTDNLSMCYGLSTNLDLLFFGEDSGWGSSFNVLEHIQPYANLTTEGVSINDSTCVASVSEVEVLKHISSDNFSICGASCDFTSPKSFTVNVSDINMTPNAMSLDVVLCFPQLTTEDMTINVSCASGSVQETFSQLGIGSCASPSEFVINTTVCMDDNISVITFDNGNPTNNKRHLVLDAIVFYNVINASAEMIYNDTLDLYQSKNEVLWDTTGNKNVSVVCNETNTSELVQIGNVLPMVNFISIMVNSIEFAWADAVNIGTIGDNDNVTLTYSIFDIDLINHTDIMYDPNGSQIWTDFENTSGTDSHLFNDSFFNLSGTYNYSVEACDGSGCVNSTRTFILRIDETNYTSIFNVAECPDDTLQQTLIFIFIGIFLLALLFFSIIYIKIPIFAWFIGFGFIIYGMSMIGCNWLIGIIVVVFGLGCIIYETFGGK